MLFGFHPEKALANAERLVQQGKFAGAIDIYEKLIAQQPTILSLKNNLGDLYVQVGRTQEALELFEQVANHLENEGLQSRAMAVMRKMLKLDSDQLELQRRLARVLTEQGMIGEARGLWLSLLDRAERASNWALAEECVKRLLAGEPESLGLLARLAQLRQSRGDAAGAQQEWLNLGRKAVDRAALESLDAALRQLHAIDPDWLPYQILRARNELIRGHAAQALALIPSGEALRHDAIAATDAWHVALDAQDLDRAQLLARVAMDAGDAASAIAMGRELLKQGDSTQVMDWITGDPAWFHRADLRAAWCTLLDDLLAFDPDHLRALQSWLALAAEGDAAAPDLAPRRLRLAELSREHGDLLTALEQYRLLARQSPVSAAVREAIRELEAQLGLISQTPPEPEPPAEAASPAGSWIEPFAEFATPIEEALPSDAVLDLEDEWAQVADQDLEESIRQIEFFSQNGMLPAARQTLDAELARLPHDPRLQALDVVLHTRMAAEAGVEVASDHPSAGVMEFSLTPIPAAPGKSDAGIDAGIAPGTEAAQYSSERAPALAAGPVSGLDWMANAPVPAPATVDANAGSDELLGEVLPGNATPNGMTPEPPAEAAWADWLQTEPAPAVPPAPAMPEWKGKGSGGEAARLLDDLFHSFRTTVEGGAADSESDPEHQYNMGIAYSGMGLHEEAVAELQKSFLGWESQPQPPRDRLLSCGSTIALCFQQMNMPEVALAWYRRTVDAARLPVAESIGLLYEEGRLLEQLARREEALECYRQVYATNIDYQDVAECLKRVQASMAPPPPVS